MVRTLQEQAVDTIARNLHCYSSLSPLPIFLSQQVLSYLLKNKLVYLYKDVGKIFSLFFGAYSSKMQIDGEEEDRYPMELDFSKSGSYVDDRVLSLLCNSHVSLLSLDLQYVALHSLHHHLTSPRRCCAITDRGLRALLQSPLCASIHTLHLNTLVCVNDLVLECISNHCSQVKNLSLSRYSISTQHKC